MKLQAGQRDCPSHKAEHHLQLQGHPNTPPTLSLDLLIQIFNKIEYLLAKATLQILHVSCTVFLT